MGFSNAILYTTESALYTSIYASNLFLNTAIRTCTKNQESKSPPTKFKKKEDNHNLFH